MKKIIIFNPGCYGWFLEWCIKTLTTDIDINYPFDDTGSSHNSKIRTQILNWKNINCLYNKDFLDPTGLNLSARHITGSDYDLDTKKLYNTVFDNSHIQVINLHCTERNKLWVLNNRFTKVGEKYIKTMMANVKGIADFSTLVKNKSGIRRMLSIMYVNDFNEELNRTSNVLLDTRQHKHILNLNIENLKNNFFESIESCLEHYNLELKKDFSDITEIYNEWAKRQRHYHKDQLINFISKQIINSKYANFENLDLTLVDEAELLSRLKLSGIKIDYKNFPNDFPKNSKELEKYFLIKDIK